MYILVVEDERRLAQVVRKVLEEEGHTVDVAPDGEEGPGKGVGGGPGGGPAAAAAPLPKPFAFQELLPRLRALGRRRVQAREPDQLQTSDLMLDLRRRRAVRDGRTIDLSPKEFALLEFLMRNQGRGANRTQSLDHVWGYDD